MVPEGTGTYGTGMMYYRTGTGEYVPFAFGAMVLPPLEAYPKVTDVIGGIGEDTEFTIQCRSGRGRRARRAFRRNVRKLKWMLLHGEEEQ